MAVTRNLERKKRLGDRAMKVKPITRGFTLIELLTVIAIIAVLAAIIFPVMSTVREQTRQTSCLSNMHQLYVAVGIYKADNEGYPPALLGYVQYNGNQVIPASNIADGYLYRDDVKDINTYKCPDNPTSSQTAVTTAVYPPSTPIASAMASTCPTQNGLTEVCWTSQDAPPGVSAGTPKLFYTWDSYDINPMLTINGNGVAVPVSGVYVLSYSPDWTGVVGLNDSVNQLKYKNPPLDKTVLATCTWHTVTNGSPVTLMILASGTVKKVQSNQYVTQGPLNIFGP